MAEKPISRKPLFNLNLVVQETGIKPDTLRAWERRYQIPTPSRTDGGHRLFSSYDIATIHWLLARQEEGMRISQAVDYWRELLAAGIDPLLQGSRVPSPAAEQPAVRDSRQPLEVLRQQWIEGSLGFDEDLAERALDAAFTHYPWEIVCSQLIYPGLAEVGENWYSGESTVQQEHFTSELVIRKLQTLIAAAPHPIHPQKALISNPPGEFHTIAPLALNLLLRYRGWEVVYLGADVPLDHLQDALASIQPALVIMTAARLSTCAAILDAAAVLQDLNLPLAYGGFVFTQTPALVDRVPGTYLGNDLGQAVSRIEQLLSDPDPSFGAFPTPSPYRGFTEAFRRKLPILTAASLEGLANEDQSGIPREMIQAGVNFLFEDLEAALALGSIEFLEPNLDWLQGLLMSRAYGRGVFKALLENFIQAARKEFQGEADPILHWLAAFAERLQPGRVS